MGFSHFPHTVAALNGCMVRYRRRMQEPVMTVQDRIADYLIRESGRSYCDDCLSTMFSIPPHQVQKEVTALVVEGWVKRSYGKCTSCESSNFVNRRRMSSFAA
jgi:hypothetical protein